MKGKSPERARAARSCIYCRERHIVQNIYIRRIDKIDGKLTNVDIATYPMVKDEWKIDNLAK